MCSLIRPFRTGREFFVVDMIFHAVMQATLVSKLVLALLLFMSLVSWAYMALPARGTQAGAPWP